MRVLARALAVICPMLLLGSCYVPEKFTTTITVNKNGSYKFVYDGTLAQSLAVMKAKSEGLSTQDEGMLRQEGVRVRSGDVRKMDYVGNGRYETFYEHAEAGAQPMYFPSRDNAVLVVEPQANGTIRIAASRPTTKDMDELRALDIKIDGVVIVKLENGVTVLEQNADSQPKLFGVKLRGIRTLLLG